jgi:hypothetical protein
MKRTIIILATGIFSFSCNNKNNDPAQKENTTSTTEMADTTDAEIVKPAFAVADANFSSGYEEAITHYLELKNALATDDAPGAAKHANALKETVEKVNTSSLEPGQKKIFDNNKENILEHAEHIGKNAGNIKHQRDDFASLSEDLAELVKMFGSSQPLYGEHCPMAGDNKGADCISETKVIRNPYFGKKMLECGTVEKIYKNQ